jgi:ribosomal protein S27AE
MINVVPISAQQQQLRDDATCPNCGAAIVADQRYCLSCGQPCSPMRLEFLDVLQSGEATAQTTVLQAPAGYVQAYLPAAEPDGALGWLRRYSGLLALVGVLLVTGLIGLLIGHWTKSPAAPSGPQVVKIEGGLPLAAGASTTASTPVSTSGSATAAAPLSKAQEEKEVKEAEASTVKAPPPVKTSHAGLQKLSKSTGKAHKKEIEALTAGGKPIETGG